MRFVPVLVAAALALVPQAASAQATPLLDSLQREQTDSSQPVTPGDQAERESAKLLPYGAQLFNGQFAAERGNAVNPDYVIAPGDRITVHVWGAIDFSGTLSVDYQGNIFVPEVGPVPVAGVSNGQLNQRVMDHLNRVFTDQVQAYTNLASAQPIGVFVTGAVTQPGRYAGDRTDSILYFLDRAKGVDRQRGSYRRIHVVRDGARIGSIDLYAFLTDGVLPGIKLEEGDTIVVGQVGPTVAVSGDCRNANLFEFTKDRHTGREIAAYAKPMPDVSHVSVTGTRDGQPFSTYVTLADFLEMPLQDGDAVSFRSDQVDDMIFVSVSGHANGPSSFAMRKGTRLGDFLDIIEVDPEIADIDAIYLRRESVARRQAAALEAALQALEKSVLTTPSVSSRESEIRLQEADLVARFVERARTIKPEGRVVIAHSPNREDLKLEPGDEVVIPQKTNVVLISGEVLLPQTVLYREGMSLQDYIRAAGGYTERADRGKPLIMRPSGEIVTDTSAEIGPGDHVMVLSKADTKSFAIGMDLVQVIYQIAVAAGVVLQAY